MGPVDDDFSTDQWDQPIKQTVMTLNMLQLSWINPEHLAYNQVWRNLKFNL